MKKIFYDPSLSIWRYFEAPEKPNRKNYESGSDTPTMAAWFVDPAYYDAVRDYEKAYAEAKENALEVGNAEILKKVGYLDLKLHGDCFDWNGTAVIRDNKYYLSV